MGWPVSFRAKILLVVVPVAVLPVGLTGLWLTGTARRAGEQLLMSRLSDVIDETASQLHAEWTRSRSRLLDFADDPVVRESLTPSPPSAATSPTLWARLADSVLSGEFPVLRDELVSARAVTSDGDVRWSLLAEPDRRTPDAPGVALSAAVHESVLGQTLGTISARVAVDALWDQRGPAARAGVVVGLFDGDTGASLLPVLFDPTLLGSERFAWAGEEWLTRRKRLENPPVELVAAAPLTPFVVPFRGAARRGAGLLLIVGVVGLALTGLLVRRMTLSLERLAHAADAVSRGDLDRHLPQARDDEVGRVIRAFNTMTDSLSRTLRRLADREALAAVGEFAAGLAHEVRNPLTAIRIDMQRVEEGLAEDSPLRSPHRRALEELERLDATVGSVLDMARTTLGDVATVDVRVAMDAAVHASAPAFDERGAVLHTAGPHEPIPVRGDLGALEQLFLNLLLNAAQALDPGGVARLTAELERGWVTVRTLDEGRGMTPEQLERVFEPLFTTRPGGTGLGLTISRRIAAAHGGSIQIESDPERGTTVDVRLPLSTL